MTQFYEKRRGVLRDEQTGLPFHNHSLTDFVLVPCDCGDSQFDMPETSLIVSEKVLLDIFGYDADGRDIYGKENE